jgi:hypothetical protein
MSSSNHRGVVTVKKVNFFASLGEDFLACHLPLNDHVGHS